MSFRSMRLELIGFVPELNAVQAGLRLNRSYEHLLDAHTWSFLNVEALVKLLAPYNAGTATVTNGLATVQGAATVWTAGMANRYFRCGDSFVFYKISSVDAVTQVATLEATFGEASAALQPYTIFKHVYTKPTDCKHIRSIRYDYNLPQVTKDYLDTLEPERSSTGQPFYWTMHDEDTFEIWPVPDANYTLRMYYRRQIADLNDSTNTSALLPERLILKHAQIAAYQQMASTEAGMQRYMPMYQAELSANKAKTPGSFTDLWDTAVEEDMHNLSLPGRVLVQGYDVPEFNDYLMRHDAGDPRRYM